MGKYRPLVASIAVAALALGVLGAWASLRPPANAPDLANDAVQPPPSNSQDTGLTYVETVREPRDQRDPDYLWPMDGDRLSAPETWVLWQTAEHSACRLLASKDGRLWFDLGSTSGTNHFLKLDFAFFDGRAIFVVDFVHRGSKFRSRPRTVDFSRGARFGQRRQVFRTSGGTDEKYLVTVEGRDPAQINPAGFMHGWFEDDLVVGYRPLPGNAQGGSMEVILPDASIVPAAGTVGWLQLFDELTGAYDRMLIHFERQ